MVGGLVPDYLTSAGTVAHQGTADVDIVLTVGVVWDRDAEDFGWLEGALLRSGFRPDEATGGWRWRTLVDGFAVKMEFLCDIPGDMSNAPVRLHGCRSLAAKNLQGPGPAITDTMAVRLGSAGDPGGITVQVAGLGGYVLAKAAAADGRGEDRDFYDLVFVLIFNDAGGPSAAARAVGQCLARIDDPIGTREITYVPKLRRALDDITDGAREGAWAYARVRQQVGAAEDQAMLVEDAVSAVMEFREALPPPVIAQPPG